MGKSLEVRPAALLRPRAHDHSPYHGRVHRAPSPSRLTIALIAATIVLVVTGLALFGSRLNWSAADKPAPTASTLPTTSAPSASTPTPTVADVSFAVIGDFGSGDQHEADVARLVASWDPAFIVGLGDVYYSEAGGSGSERYDRAVGRYYCRWLKDVSTTGSACPQGGASKNAFFTTIGNHDISDAEPSPESYLDYFDLPGNGFTNTSGNERYYDFVEGPVHFFVLNSNDDEPDGITADSRQATWLRSQVAASTSRWNVVVDHHPPYSSDNSHGPTVVLQWPFARWGVDVVMSGHAHTYERIQRDGITYFVNGLGGAHLYSFGAQPVDGSKVRFADNWGAQRVRATQDSITFDFIDVSGALIDSYVVR